jgi:hypothetical protein
MARDLRSFQRKELVATLRAQCDERTESADAPDWELFELLTRAFGDRTGLLDESNALLDQASIPYGSDFWPFCPRCRNRLVLVAGPIASVVHR